MSSTIELTIWRRPTQHTPATSLVYTANENDPRVAEALQRVADNERRVQVDASILELAYRYHEKRVDNATLRVNSSIYEDTDGDGLIESSRGGLAQRGTSIFQALCNVFEGSTEPGAVRMPPLLYDTVQSLRASEAAVRAFVASCGSTVVEIHQTRSHSMIWASIPSGAEPNEVHRHLGGSVYCIFYRGQGFLHRVDHDRGFETLQIAITGNNSYEIVTIPTHLWYQPINTGSTNLEYFMVHEPAFDHSEQLILMKEERPPEWRFEYVE